MHRQKAGTVHFCLRITLSLLFTLAIGISFAAAQTPGVTENSILIGSCSALDGPAHAML